jgi:hypothetical protein
MRTLQTFSLLRLLAFVHPNQLSKNYSAFSILAELARVVLEKLIGRQPNTTSDSEMAEVVTIELMKHISSDGESVKRQKAHSWMSLRPRELIDLLVSTEVNRHVREDWVRKLRRVIWIVRAVDLVEVISFLVIVVASALMGSTAFFTKLCTVSRLLTDPTSSTSGILLGLAVFCNGCLSIVSVNELLIFRVQKFIFGGTDAVISSEESYVIKVYLASLAEKILESDELSLVQKAILMVQLDDDDFQRLVIEEDSESKSRIILSVKKSLGFSDQSWSSWLVKGLTFSMHVFVQSKQRVAQSTDV